MAPPLWSNAPESGFTMRVRICRQPAGAIDGIYLAHLRAGLVYVAFTGAVPTPSFNIRLETSRESLRGMREGPRRERTWKEGTRGLREARRRSASRYYSDTARPRVTSCRLRKPSVRRFRESGARQELSSAPCVPASARTADGAWLPRRPSRDIARECSSPGTGTR